MCVKCFGYVAAWPWQLIFRYLLFKFNTVHGDSVNVHSTENILLLLVLRLKYQFVFFHGEILKGVEAETYT